MITNAGVSKTVKLQWTRMFLVNACCRLFMDADLNDGLTLCFARHSWACCEESAHDATSKVGELFEVRPLVSKAAGYCSSHRFIKPHPLSLMWLFLSVLLCSHFFPPLFFPSLHPPSPSSLLLSPGPAGGFSWKPRQRPVWGEQRGGQRSLSQHQEGSFPRDFQPARVRAPSAG